jgi:sensor c-di-GMP phosphodiesterase-like protein
MTTPDGADIRALTEVAESLREQVENMNQDVACHTATLAKQVKRQALLTRCIFIALACVGVLAMLVALAIYRTDSITHRLDVQSTVSRQKALCPLYQVLIDRDTPKARSLAPDKAAYDQAYSVIHEGYTALDCKAFKGSAPKLG